MGRLLLAASTLLLGGCAAISQSIAVGIADKQATALLTPTGPAAPNWSDAGVDPTKFVATHGGPAVLFEADPSAPTIYAYDVDGLSLVPPGWAVTHQAALGAMAPQGRQEIMLARLSPLSMVMLVNTTERVGSARCVAPDTSLSVTYLRPVGLRDLPLTDEEVAMDLATRRYFTQYATARPCSVLRKTASDESYRFFYYAPDGRPLGRMTKEGRPVNVVSVADIPRLLRLR